jgi:hypothetical protein
MAEKPPQKWWKTEGTDSILAIDCKTFCIHHSKEGAGFQVAFSMKWGGYFCAELQSRLFAENRLQFPARFSIIKSIADAQTKPEGRRLLP